MNSLVQSARTVVYRWFLGVAASLGLVCLFVGCGDEQAQAVPVRSKATRETGSNLPSPSATGPLQSSSPKKDAAAVSESASILDVIPQFSEVASEVGIRFVYFNDEVPDRFFLPEVMGGGVAWFDYDRDGRLDLYCTNGARIKDPDPNQTEHLNRLFRQVQRGTFADITTDGRAHEAGYGQGCAVGDFDADGFPDLYLTNYGRDALLANNGDGTFTDVTNESGTGDPLWGSSSVWFDADGDGYLDLYVVNYLDVTLENSQICKYHGKWGYCGPGTYKGVPDRLYLSRGDGTFEDATDRLGFHGENGNGLAVIVVDFDQDLQAEVYVANDMTPKFLFTRSRIAGTTAGALYSEIGMDSGSAVSGNGESEASMGIACSDFDGDGLVDIFLTHFYGAKNTFYRNLGGLMFDDDSYRSRSAATAFNTLGFGVIGLDYDRNGSTDLFITNGHVLGRNYEVNELRPQLLMNLSGVFWEISESAGPYFHGKYLGRGAAGADYDDDGDLDLAVTHLERPLALLRNDTETRRHYLGLSLHCPNRVPPVGGRIVVTSSGGQSQTVPITAGGSYLCSSDARIIVGLGEQSDPAEVEIFWPSGRVDRYGDLQVDRYWSLLEGRPPEPVPND